MKNLKEKLTYRKDGDYLLPNLAVLKDECNNYHIGKYGYLRLDYLKKNKRGYYTELMLYGKLPEHLIEIDKQANKRLRTIISILVKLQNINEKLKSNNQMEWVRLMNNFKKSAEDIVLSELIYN